MALAGRPDRPWRSGIEARLRDLDATSETAVAAEVVGAAPAAPKQRRAQRAGGLLRGTGRARLPRASRSRARRGSTTTAISAPSSSPKIAMRLQLGADAGCCAPRSGGGFRAPSLPELYTQQISSLDYVPMTTATHRRSAALPGHQGARPTASRQVHRGQRRQPGAAAAATRRRSNAGIVFELGPRRGWRRSTGWSHPTCTTSSACEPRRLHVANDLSRYDGPQRDPRTGRSRPIPTCRGRSCDIETI